MSHYLSHDQRLSLIAEAHAQGVTLNGERAVIAGARNGFATVASLESGASFEWAWPTVSRIVSNGGRFTS